MAAPAAVLSILVNANTKAATASLAKTQTQLQATGATAAKSSKMMKAGLVGVGIAVDVSAVAKASQTDTELDSFVFRLRRPDGTPDIQAQRAFDELVQSFSTVRAEALALARHPGVTLANLDERERCYASQAGVNAFARAILAREVALSRRGGVLVDRDGATLRYTVHTRTADVDNYFREDASVRWRLATAQRDGEPPRSTLTFRAARRDYEAEDADVRSFLALCAAAGVPGAAAERYAIEDIDDFVGFFSSEDDLRETFEASIESEGILSIDRARHHEAFRAYVSAALLFDPSLGRALPWLQGPPEVVDRALRLVTDYADHVHVGLHCLCPVVSDSHTYMEMDATDYRDLMREEGYGERRIESDYRVLRSIIRDARPFARAVERLHTQGGADHSRLEPFFRSVSHLRRKEGRRRLAALMLLAGPHNVTLHEATLECKGANFQYDSEGPLDESVLDQWIAAAMVGTHGKMPTA